MRLYALELNNDIRGERSRRWAMEQMIARLDDPDLVVLPELAMSGYLADESVWQYADLHGQRTAAWAREMAAKYRTAIGVGYLETDGRDFYNAYLIADANCVYGSVRKSEGESYLFKRGKFGHVIPTAFGNVAVGICYDSRRRQFYEDIKNRELALILLPHGAPADPKKADGERKTVDRLCNTYLRTFGVPVVYVNSVGAMPHMLGRTGKMMERSGFAMNGGSTIYSPGGRLLPDCPEGVLGLEWDPVSRKRRGSIRFHGEDLLPGNTLFRRLILPRDIADGVEFYEAHKDAALRELRERGTE